MIPTKYIFRLPTRQEYRKYNFKKDDGVLKSLEYLVHTTIIEPSLEEFLKLEQQKVTLTEELGQRLADMLIVVDYDKVERIEIDINSKFCPINVGPTSKSGLELEIESIIIRILKENKLL